MVKLQAKFLDRLNVMPLAKCDCLKSDGAAIKASTPEQR
jgi:hypothetical protein